MVRTRQFITKHQKALRIVFISLWVLCAFFNVTAPLFAQSEVGDVDGIWDKVTDLIRGPIGKSIAVVGFVVGAIAIFLGNVPAGIMTLVGAAVIAFAPAIVNLLFE